MATVRAWRRCSRVGGGILLETRALAAASRRMPVGLPEASRSILAPAGSGVAAVMLAAARAAELATAMCPSTRRKMAGWPAVTASRSVREGSLVVGPEGVVPSSALDPCAGFGGGDVDADALLHLGEGVDADEVDGELLAAGFADVGVGVVEAGHGEGAVEVDDLGLGAFEFQEVGVGAGGEDFSVGDGDGGDLGGGCGGVVWAEVGAGEDVAVEEDGVGCLRLGEGSRARGLR